MLVSGEGYEEGILVDMEALENGEGQTVANVCTCGIEKSKCKENVVILVFDTPNANTGIHKGAASILERDVLERKIIWGGCRKHVAELEVRAAHKVVFGIQNLLIIPYLAHFRKLGSTNQPKHNPRISTEIFLVQKLCLSLTGRRKEVRRLLCK